MNQLLTSPAHLIAALTLAGTLGSPAVAADEPDDLLRFANGDVIHGHFVGVENGPRLMWQRDDLPSPVGFDASKLRQLVFNSGKPTNALASPSNAVMVNGDLLPGRILKLTDTALTLETEFAGTLEIPRTAVAQINPNPHGGQLHYSGPFNTDGWTMPADANAKDAPALEDEDMPRDPFAPARPQRPANQPQKGEPWLFSGAAFYSNGTLPLLRDVHMPDRARLRFEIAWRSRLNLTIGFHADMKVPTKAAEPQQPQFRGQQNYPYIFGNSYVLTIYSSYAQLWRSGFDEAGNPLSPERIQVGNTSLNLPESGSAVLELRCDRKAKTIALYINDEFALQWDEADTPYAGKGSGIGFICPAGSNQVRISEVLVASWNGMSDSARSMESADTDVVLLVNGTDRFAGNIRQIDNGEVTLTGTYAEMRIPLTEVAEIHFAKDRRMAVAEPSAKNATVKFFPLGRVTGQLITSKDGSLTMDSPILGKLDVNLRYPIMFDFSNTSSFIDDWNVGF
jgi:hypothetical protein